MKSHFPTNTANNSRGFTSSLFRLFTLGMLAAMSCATSWANPLPAVQLLTPSPTFQGILEGTGPAIIDFGVKNKGDLDP